MIILKNNTNNVVPVSDIGQSVPASGQLILEPAYNSLYVSSSDIITLVGNNTLTVNNGQSDLSPSQGIDLVKGILNTVEINAQPAFANKILPNGKKLYTRVYGITQALTVGSNIIDYSIALPHVKFNEIELIGAELGDYIKLEIKDDATGTYSTVPNYTLNQFGNNVYCVPTFYNRKSNYDADLYYGMRIYATYTSLSNKNVYINFILHEVV